VATVILENVSAHFPIYGAQQRSLRNAIFQRATGGTIEREGKNSVRVTVKALSDISLTLHDGDRLGLLGHNGAGKSTLLKLMAGIYQPVSGTIKVEGRVTPLFDAMPGLDGEDSGYENIITSGMLIGMTRQQVEMKIPEIEEFCELGEYLTLPVRTYSAGMTMRLGFALVTALDPGVLLMDEGIGAGDQRFAERAEARMKDFIGRSRILVLASHSDRTIRSMCNKAIIMESGRIVAFGAVNEICDQYYESVHAAAMTAERARQREQAASTAPSPSGEPEAAKELMDAEGGVAQGRAGSSLEFASDAAMPGDDVVRLCSARVHDSSFRKVDDIDRGEKVGVEMTFEVRKAGYRLMPNFHVFLRDQYAFVSSPPQNSVLEPGIYRSTLWIPRNFLNDGVYVVGVALTSLDPTRVHFYLPMAVRFHVSEKKSQDFLIGIPGVVRPALDWDLACETRELSQTT
jgi:ABC-type polysaccharide/polyol phosphate transport system ATPase subunit